MEIWITGRQRSLRHSLINSNDLLAKVQYPDKTLGTAGTNSTDAVVYSYDALGETTGMTDRNGNVHAYLYDALGRMTRDTATAIGSGVDGTTRRYDFTYDTGGRLQSVTGLNLAGSAIYSQVVDSYNGLGQLIEEDQALGAVTDPAATPGSILYGYNEMAGGANNSRQTSMTYPDGRIITYDYNPGIDSAISRVSAIGEGTGTNHAVIEGYSYLGLSTIVEQTRPQNGTKLSYIQQSGDTLAGANPSNDGGDQYTGLDRFGRIVDQWWFTTASGTPSATIDRFQYGYDPNGNVLYKNNLGPGTNAAGFSELYHANASAVGDNATAYDNLNRLTGFRRGVLSSSGNNGASLDTVTTLNSNTNVAGSQSFSLDAQGNTSTLTTNGTAQSRTTNDQNQYSTLTTGTNTVTLTYDNNGALTTDEQGRALHYDAWGRLSYVYDPATGNLDAYVYDGLSRIAFGQRTVTALGITFYRVRSISKEDQVIEERDTGVSSTTPQYQYVYGLSYVDDVVERDSYYDSITGTAGHDRLWAEHDANHDVTSIVDNSGTPVERFVYDPYGKFTVLDGATWVNISDSRDWANLHQGMRWDAETGLYEDRLRFYSPSLQRFVSQDPTGSMYIDGANLYQYVDSNPIALADPSGLNPLVLVPGAGLAGLGEAGALVPGIGSLLVGAAILGYETGIHGDVRDGEEYNVLMDPSYPYNRDASDALHEAFARERAAADAQAAVNAARQAAIEERAARRAAARAAAVQKKWNDFFNNSPLTLDQWMAQNQGGSANSSGCPYSNTVLQSRAGDLPAKGPPNSTGVKDYGGGKGQIRVYGPDGKAVVDYDFGHNHPPTYPGDPHAHDWDWTQQPPRSPARPLRPGE